MTRLLVTGADGFVGRWLVRAARAAGHQVVAAILPDGTAPNEWLTPGESAGCEMVRADLREAAGVAALVATAPEAVVHLAAVASGDAARRDPAAAWTINAGATAALADALAHGSRPTFLLVSTGEVYGRDHVGPIPETAALVPCSPYAASKVGAEARRARGAPPHGAAGGDRPPVPPYRARAGDRSTSSRPSPPGSGTPPRLGATEVAVGNLEPVRDLLDVRDVVEAYLALLAKGQPGQAYNVASGIGHHLAECFESLARITGAAVRPVQDASLLRTADLPVLIGDPARIRALTGWAPRISLDRTLQDLVHAQAD